VTGPLGTGTYRCEITTETPSFVTLERRKNITVVGNDEINNKFQLQNPIYAFVFRTILSIRVGHKSRF
jgi:hypothetical protein